MEELRKYEQKVRADVRKESAGKRKKGPKLSDYSRWFTKYQAGSLEFPGYTANMSFFAVLLFVG